MRHVRVAVIGGGITGQLLQHAVADAEVYDWGKHPTVDQRSTLTRAFGANYLWAPIPGYTHREFRVTTHIDYRPATFDRVEAYKNKIGKTGDVADWVRQFKETMTGYEITGAPTPRILYEHRVSSVDRLARRITFEKGLEPIEYDYLISTIPLPALLKMAGMPIPNGGLHHKPIYVKVGPRPPDAVMPIEDMYVNYLSDPTLVPYRFCDRSGERHYEAIVPFPSGLSTRVIRPGKIYPNDEVPEYLAVLAENNIFTFGRFGSWEADELVHETWARIVAWKEALCA